MTTAVRIGNLTTSPTPQATANPQAQIGANGGSVLNLLTPLAQATANPQALVGAHGSSMLPFFGGGTFVGEVGYPH